MITLGTLCWWILQTFAFIVVWNVVKRMLQHPNYPPGPPGLPLIGYLPLARAPTDEQWRSMWKRYGDIFSVQVGSVDLVIICGYDAAKEAFMKKELLHRPPLPHFTLFAKGNYGVVCSSGPLWEEQRRFALRQLRDLGYGKSALEGHILEEVSWLVNRFKEKTGRPVEIEYDLNIAMVNILWAMVAGMRLEHDDPRIRYTLEMFQEAQRLIGFSTALSFIPWLTRLLPSFITRLNDLEMWRDQGFKHVDDIIEEHLRRGPSDAGDEDYVSRFLKKMKEEEGNPNTTFTAYQLRIVAAELFVAGNDTSTASLRWAIYLLAGHPEIQRKVQEELDKFVGRDRVPTLEDRKNLHYTEAVIQEIHRCASVFPMCPRQAAEDVNVGPYTITAGTFILVSLLSVHRDPKYWERPDEFYPEHFLNKDGTFSAKKEGFLAFAAGKRNCLGESLVKILFYLFFTAFVHKFSFELPEGTKITLERDQSMPLMRYAKPYKVIIKERN